MNALFCDLGLSPLANAFVDPAALGKGEAFYPLKTMICDSCLLVQLGEFVPREELFSDYKYFSSYSETWLQHARKISDLSVSRFNLGPESFVVEVASNDGYLLRNFVAAGIPCLGVEPASNVAAVAIEKGIPTHCEFFGRRVAEQLRDEKGAADIIFANNVLAHVPDLNDFVSGFKALIAPSGTILFEFPHIYDMIREVQFDTIYHEHFSYFSLKSAEELFRRHGLRVYDAERIPTHGGSLRLYVCHSETGFADTSRLVDIRDLEQKSGLCSLEGYQHFDREVAKIKYDTLKFLIDLKGQGKKVIAYGAAAKGNTFLNYCGIHSDLISTVIDRNPHKQGHFLPGSRIEICSPETIRNLKPDIIMILPWNLKEEISASLDYAREWGGEFFVCIPQIEEVSCL